ncbi:hypothetical protein VTL71DRAFT_14836 [Oculimacula yallundae]|uniref:Uncharacterized protein n=1 Tax=Oculimacula yallundae TaxID=86028 RepID=A0ABR4CEW5_9HELO
MIVGSTVSKKLRSAKQQGIRGDFSSDEETAEGLREIMNGKRPVARTDRVMTKRSANLTLAFADDLSRNSNDRIIDPNGLKEAAEHTEKALHGLLRLKQQQADVAQAREAHKQIGESIRQGRAIALLATILPRSFSASIFGMNTAEYGNGQWSLRREIKYMLPISAGVIVASFVLAFNSFTRALVSLIFVLGWKKFTTTTRIPSEWVWTKMDSQNFTRIRRDLSWEWEEAAKVTRHRRKEDRQRMKEHKEIEELKEDGTRNSRVLPGMA